MKKSFQTLSLLLLLCISTISFAQQNFQGKAYYMSKTTMDLDQWGGREMSPEQKKRIQERMKSFLEKEYILTFNKEESQRLFNRIGKTFGITKDIFMNNLLWDNNVIPHVVEFDTNED